ncbi:DUF1972 domain-containing protein [Paeniglutamicibacter antarcticus]|uniref:DUF1972 domain-containing protein n=1 Tax=Arthrobacter terrae TaxID=2935737 RepID=A0A931G4E9_9MICC|nr:DUF1972 domain-containing protein [Arthrobacter terrae]MBG0738325.1 DUF1972 domain-containing protein [Arthrobacter terrae]
MHLALVGTRGVPARYGGFETCVEEVGKRLVARGHRVSVYCRTEKGSSPLPAEYLGMKLIHLPAPRKRSLETLCHTGLSIGHILGHRVDTAIVFNAANAPWLPFLRAARIPFATHVDGLEWQRARWGKMGQKYYRTMEALSVRLSDALIADAVGIQDYYREEFDVDTTLLTYGAPILEPGTSNRINGLGLESKKYHLVVARFLPENHVHMIVDGYTKSGAKYPLVVVGSHPYAEEYTRQLHALGDQRVQFIGGVWDQSLLDDLYANALVYWHGHSVGGTNPSLLRAMGAGAATNAFDVSFNREVLGDAGRYFSSPADVRALAEHAERSSAEIAGRGIASVQRAHLYSWDDIALGYEALCRRLISGEQRRSSGKGRRLGTSRTQSFGYLPKVGA